MRAAFAELQSAFTGAGARHTVSAITLVCLVSASSSVLGQAVVPKQGPVQGMGLELPAPPRTARVRKAPSPPKKTPTQGNSNRGSRQASTVQSAAVSPTSTPVVAAEPTVMTVSNKVPVANVPQTAAMSSVDASVAGESVKVTAMSVAPTSAPASLGEVLPRTEVLVSSMKDMPLPRGRDPQPLAGQSAVTPSTNSCVPVTLSQDDRRVDRLLVDLTGDGLIVAPVDKAHVDRVLGDAGLASPHVSEAARYCLPRALVQDLIKTGAKAKPQEPMVLVQNRAGWQLVSSADLVTPVAAKRKPGAVRAKKRVARKTKATRTASLPRKVASR